MTQPDDGFAQEVRAAAKATAREWSDVIDADDMEQEMWLRLLDSSKSYVERVQALNPGERRAVLNNIGHQLGMKYRDDYDTFSGNYRYSSPEVRALLEGGALLGDEPDIDSVTVRVDLTEGVQTLAEKNSNYFAVLVNKYVHGIDPNNGSERMRLTRAIDLLTRLMNGAHRRGHSWYQGPGNRTVTTNRLAQVITTKDYKGGYDEGRR